MNANDNVLELGFPLQSPQHHLGNKNRLAADNRKTLQILLAHGLFIALRNAPSARRGTSPTAPNQNLKENAAKPAWQQPASPRGLASWAIAEALHLLKAIPDTRDQSANNLHGHSFKIQHAKSKSVNE